MGERRYHGGRGRLARLARLAAVFVLMQVVAVVMTAVLGERRSLAIYWAIAIGAGVALLVDEARRHVLPTAATVRAEVDVPDAA